MDKSQTPQTPQTPIVVSFYTKDTPYEMEVKNLIASLERWEIEYDIRGVVSLGDWQANCNMKAAFCRDRVQELGRPIIWLDVDAVVHASPSLFWQLSTDYDFAICPIGPFQESKFLSGTLWFNCSDAAQRLLDAWVAACQKPTSEWTQKERNTPDQIFLHTAWKQLSADAAVARLRTFWLPQSYCAIFDKPLPQELSPVIVHYQASGRFKHLIAAGTAV